MESSEEYAQEYIEKIVEVCHITRLTEKADLKLTRSPLFLLQETNKQIQKLSGEEANLEARQAVRLGSCLYLY